MFVKFDAFSLLSLTTRAVQRAIKFNGSGLRECQKPALAKNYPVHEITSN